MEASLELSRAGRKRTEIQRNGRGSEYSYSSCNAYNVELAAELGRGPCCSPLDSYVRPGRKPLQARVFVDQPGAFRQDGSTTHCSHTVV